LFSPTVKSGSFAVATHDHAFGLKDISPSGPAASAVDGKDHPAPVEKVRPDLAAMREFSDRQATRQSDEGAECLEQAMQALKDGNLRGQWPKAGSMDRYKPGAIELFKRARLLADQHPEPTLGLIVSLVATADYNQASVLVDPLIRNWPSVLNSTDFAQGYYLRPEQIRTHALAIREAVVARSGMDLRLLWDFYRWYTDNRQQTLADVAQLAQLAGPDSTAAAMAQAMKAALASGG
jgi:hypothetical protein